MQLSDFFSAQEIYQDGEFQDLGYSNHSGHKILSFCDNIYYLTNALQNLNITSLIITTNMVDELPPTTKGVVISENPRQSFFKLYNYMREKNLFVYDLKYGIEESATIAKSAIISQKSYIGKNTIINENVVIKDNVFIGENCFIDIGVIIGNEGVLYMYDKYGNTQFLKHAGVVKINNKVTLLANSVVVKSVFPNMPTIVDSYSIIGIATTIGHEAKVSNNCKILGNCIVAKNVTIGANTLVGSSSVIRENISLGKNVDVKSGSIVVKDVKEGDKVSGNFAYTHSKRVRNFIKEQRS